MRHRVMLALAIVAAVQPAPAAAQRRGQSGWTELRSANRTWPGALHRGAQRLPSARCRGRCVARNSSSAAAHRHRTRNPPAIRGAPEPFSRLELRLAERAAVLTESWNAGSPEQVVARVKPLVPSALLQELVEPMTLLAAPLLLIEPAFAQLCVGRIEADRLPEPRLGARVSRSRAVEGAAGPCT